jgi:large subunit ribosomal protein L3
VDVNTVVAQKVEEKDGYSAVVLGMGEAKASRVKRAEKGRYPEGITPKKHIKEFRDFSKECSTGDTFSAELLEGCRYVDVIGTSKGKGFQGVMKRWGFGGGRKTHGSKFHREPGSTGQSTYPHKTFKNVKLPGRMGRERVSVLNLRVIKIDKENHLVLVRGAVPGVNKTVVVVRQAVKKQRA